MKKEDVPFAGRPALNLFNIAFSVIGYMLLLVYVPDTRPGLLEASLGITIGIIAALPLSYTWLSYLIALTQESKNRPWVGWAAAIAHPVPPLGMAIKYRLILMAVNFAAFFAIAFTLMKLYRLWPYMEWPYARFAITTESNSKLLLWGDMAGLESLPSTMTVFMLINILIISLASIRWYNRLPD